MRARADKSPLALTDGMAGALRTMADTPLLDAAAIARACGQAGDMLDQLCTRGLTKTQGGQRRDGTRATLYLVTRKGFSALDRHESRSRSRTPVSPARMNADEPYMCPELGRTCHRPGAYDAFTLPSLFGEERRMPQRVA